MTEKLRKVVMKVVVYVVMKVVVNVVVAELRVVRL